LANKQVLQIPEYPHTQFYFYPHGLFNHFFFQGDVMSDLILESNGAQELDISKNSILSCIKRSERIIDAASIANR